MEEDIGQQVIEKLKELSIVFDRMKNRIRELEEENGRKKSSPSHNF